MCQRCDGSRLQRGSLIECSASRKAGWEGDGRKEGDKGVELGHQG